MVDNEYMKQRPRKRRRSSTFGGTCESGSLPTAGGRGSRTFASGGSVPLPTSKRNSCKNGCELTSSYGTDRLCVVHN